MPAMHLRIAVPADVPSMFDVRTSVLENHMPVEALTRVGITADTITAMLAGDSRAWVAEENEKIVDFSIADASEATVFAIFVQPADEGNGLGRARMAGGERGLLTERCE